MDLLAARYEAAETARNEASFGEFTPRDEIWEQMTTTFIETRIIRGMLTSNQNSPC